MRKRIEIKKDWHGTKYAKVISCAGSKITK